MTPSNSFSNELLASQPSHPGDDSDELLRRANALLEEGRLEEARRQFHSLRFMKSHEALVRQAQLLDLSRLAEAIEHNFDGLVDARIHAVAGSRPKSGFVG